MATAAMKEFRAKHHNDDTGEYSAEYNAYEALLIAAGAKDFSCWDVIDGMMNEYDAETHAGHIEDDQWNAECEARDADEYEGGGIHFADPGGRSALRAATEDNPRDLPCPNCGKPNRLTPEDRAQGYQCDACADIAEGLMPPSYADY